MDAIDRKILAVVQEDASLSVAEIGQRVGLSSTPCWKRLQRLEADGVIMRRVALIDPEKIGLGITVTDIGRRNRPARRPVVDAVLEAIAAAGGRRSDHAPGRANRSGKDRAGHHGDRYRSPKSASASACRRRRAGSDCSGWRPTE